MPLSKDDITRKLLILRKLVLNSKKYDAGVRREDDAIIVAAMNANSMGQLTKRLLQACNTLFSLYKRP